MPGTQSIRTVTRPKVKQSQSKIVRHKNRAHELQGALLSVIKADQENGRPNLRKHAKVDEFQKMKEGRWKGPKRPVRQIGNGPSVKHPLVHRIENRVISEAETNRDDDVVVSEKQTKTGEHIKSG